MKATAIEQSSMNWKLNNGNLQYFSIFRILQYCHIEISKIILHEHHYINSGMANRSVRVNFTSCLKFSQFLNSFPTVTMVGQKFRNMYCPLPICYQQHGKRVKINVHT